MRLLIVLATFLLCTSYSQSQTTWPEPGSVWHYDWSGLGSGGFFRLEYVSDTLFQGTNCQKIHFENHTFIMDWNIGQIVLDSIYDGNYFTYAQGDSVFYWSEHDTAFNLLYDFSAVLGNNWIISETPPYVGANCSDSSWVQVVDTGSISINGTQRTYFRLTPVGISPLGIDGNIVEGIGNVRQGLWETGFLFPKGQNCDSTVVVEFSRYRFKCFRSDSTALYNPSGEDCEYLLTHLSIEDNELSSIDCYPNPANDQLNIRWATTAKRQLAVYDITGRVIWQMEVNDHSHIVEVADWPRGQYFLEEQSEKGRLVQKFVLM